MLGTRSKPKKPSQDFPLFPHASGQWAKKIRGRLFYFGVWANADAAFKKYLDQRDCLQAGLKPPGKTDRTSLVDLCNRFLKAKQERVESGELGQLTLHDYKRTCGLLLDNFGRTRVADTVDPDDFTRLRAAITSRFGLARSAREITQVRMIFRWGHEQELIGHPRFGPEFAKPTKEVFRRYRQSHPRKTFEADEIRAMLAIAGVQTKAWILLGINCGFTQRDVSDLTIQAVDLDAGIVDFPRGKTGIERRAPLWPETVAALKNSLARRRCPPKCCDIECFFISREGNRVVRNHESGSRSDAVHNAIRRLQRKIAIDRPRRSFGALRHTFRTVADETCDFPAILRIMGRSDNSIFDRCREPIADARLGRIVDHVRDWLFRADTTSPKSSQ